MSTLQSKSVVPCNTDWGRISECNSRLSLSSFIQRRETLNIWGRKRLQYPLLSRSVSCQSTINGEVSMDLSVKTMELVEEAVNGVNVANGSTDFNLDQSILGVSDPCTNGEPMNGKSVNGASTRKPDELEVVDTAAIHKTPTTDDITNSNEADIARPTEAGGYTHTTASKAKISAANKGKTPWNKGKSRSEETRARIAEGVRRKNRERFLAKLEAEGITEEEYHERQKEKRRKADAERRARKTAAGGYKPTEETKKKISKILKEKYANGEIVRKPRDPSTIRKGFKHTEETKAKIAETLRRKWAEDTDYREYMTERTIANGEVRNSSSVRTRISETLKKRWEEPEFRAMMLEKFQNRKKTQSSSKALEHRQKISDAMKRKWRDDEYRKKALRGMAKQRDSAPPRLVKPVQPKQPKGAVKKADPLKQTVKKKRKKKKKSVVKKKTSIASKDSGDNVKLDAPSVSAVEPMSAKAAREIPTESLKEEEELPEGSIERLRRDRKDLYDLLYGDDDDMTASPAHNGEDASFTSNLLTSATKSRRGPVKKESSPKPVFANGDSGGSELASLLADDGDLDDFDPYGLDNF